MSRHSKLTLTNTVDFYFRRLKRIVPTYVFVMFAVLLSGILLWLYPMEYESLVKESMKPLFFMANIPDDEDANYFAQVSWKLMSRMQSNFHIKWERFYLARKVNCNLKTENITILRKQSIWDLFMFVLWNWVLFKSCRIKRIFLRLSNFNFLINSIISTFNWPKQIYSILTRF